MPWFPARILVLPDYNMASRRLSYFKKTSIFNIRYRTDKLMSIDQHKIASRQAVGDGVRSVRLALFKYLLRPVVHGLVRPVVVATFQRFPALFRLRLPRWHRLP